MNSGEVQEFYGSDFSTDRGLIVSVSIDLEATDLMSVCQISSDTNQETLNLKFPPINRLYRC